MLPASRPRSSAIFWNETADKKTGSEREAGKKLRAFFMNDKKMAVEKGLKII